jgi:hypothetical protein
LGDRYQNGHWETRIKGKGKQRQRRNSPGDKSFNITEHPLQARHYSRSYKCCRDKTAVPALMRLKL